jgi:hypothetical protein
LSLAGGGVIWLLVSTSLNRLYPLLQNGSPWVYWVVSISAGLGAFIWVMMSFNRFYARREGADNPFENPEHVRMYWEAMVAQEGEHDRHDWIYDDRGRILGPWDQESGEILTVERFMQKKNESLDDKR